MDNQDHERINALSNELLRARGVDASAEELLRRKGIAMSVEEIFDLVLRKVIELPDIEESPSFENPSPEIQQRLRGVGITLEPFESDDDPIAATITAYADLLASSLSTGEAAEVMGVNPSRIRQLLIASPPGLYGIKKGKRGSWRLPRFQFDDSGLIRGIGDVLAVLNPDINPLEVATWFTAPSPDLVTEDDLRYSPIQWLQSGHSIDSVAEIAEDIF